MKKKSIYPEKFKVHVREICRELQYWFMLRDYEVKVRWEEDQKKAREYSSHDNGTTVAASIWVDTVYLSIEIHVMPFLLDHWKEGSYRTVLECLVHEFSHVITEPLYTLACRAASSQTKEELESTRERQTERIAKLFCQRLPKDLAKAAKLSHAKDKKI